jgi:CelD/BcsL family acetyltransferase involved in cellulose biosynthesis
MEFQILTFEAAVLALKDRWETLQRAHGESIFTAPDWLFAWWKHMGEPAGARLHVVAGFKGGVLKALAPLATRRKQGVRLLEWAGGEVCDYADFLLEDAGDAPALLKAIKASPHYDLARLREVRPEAACLKALEDGAKLIKVTQAHTITLTWPSGEAWLAALPYSARKQYRARMRQAEALGPLRFEVTRTFPGLEGALEALVAQKTLWAKARGVKGVFDNPGVSGFFRVIAQAESAKGNLHLSALYCGDALIAVHLGFINRGAFYCYMPSYAEEWSHVSPGRLLLIKSILWAVDNGCTEFDFLRGEEQYKNAFATGARPLKDFIHARTLLGRAAQFFYARRFARQGR